MRIIGGGGWEDSQESDSILPRESRDFSLLWLRERNSRNLRSSSWVGRVEISLWSRYSFLTVWPRCRSDCGIASSLLKERETTISAPAPKSPSKEAWVSLLCARLRVFRDSRPVDHPAASVVSELFLQGIEQ